ncbi:MAG: TIGR01620 family protein [Beijerinckiaceae bacterium]|nr:TIGR01620 family protein [Beijerinckiaceae bacterium]
MAVEPKPRPRAFRLGSAAETATGAPPGPVVIEPAVDPYEAETKALAAAHAKSAAPAEAARTKRRVAGALFSWSGLFWSATGGLISLAFGLWLARLIDDLFSWSPAFGALGLALAAAAATALLVLAAREISGFLRQRHISDLHAGLGRAREKDDFDEARRLTRQLSALYAARPEAVHARNQLRELSHDIVDGSDLIDIAERTLVEPLDAEVRREIARAAKRVSMVTALAPRAIIDVIFVAAQAVRLIRQIAVLYGGRPGALGLLKLLRSIAAHIALTGGMAAGDSIIQQFLGHGIAAKVSVRLGEGVLNGLLTARVGLSAMAVCRPLPFAGGKAPKVADVAPFLFKNDSKG